VKRIAYKLGPFSVVHCPFSVILIKGVLFQGLVCFHQFVISLSCRSVKLQSPILSCFQCDKGVKIVA
jgi:hypothetical protein